MTRDEAVAVLTAHNQLHVLEGFDQLTATQQEGLLDQIAAIDWDMLAIAGKKQEDSKGEITPLESLTLDEIAAREEEFKAAGLAAIRDHKIGAVLLAGGMGTRLGSDRPKGELNVGLTRELYIFECLINNLMDVVREAGTSIPLYIMTSEKNDADTRAFFAEHDYFGYASEDVKFFIQDMAAAVDYDGKLLMEAPGRLATSPNGNGGWFSSLARAGLLDDVHARGVEWLNIFAVDNVLQKIADPTFFGATLLHGVDCGSKVVRKANPEEKVGVMCCEDGHPSIVEYYELSDEMANARDAKGNLVYGAGVILNYLFAVSRLEKIMNEKMPVHVVEKKIPYITSEGTLVKPEEPNGYKFELLAVDMVRLMEQCLPYEVVREHEFAPIKNLHGVDSLDTARELLQQNGVAL
ncbi:MAG: UDPGP type 1 family protein [Lachnospiraceae bacterium]|nr:UDPGP type 1 family protein [Lachnospiraceae bacterium]